MGSFLFIIEGFNKLKFYPFEQRSFASNKGFAISCNRIVKRFSSNFVGLVIRKFLHQRLTFSFEFRCWFRVGTGTKYESPESKEKIENFIEHITIN